jgi:DnaJ-class molecular chaperone
MDKQVDCPACEGRGVYCLRAGDPAWSELTIAQSPCDYCNGVGKVAQADAAQFDPRAARPYFPFQEE